MNKDSIVSVFYGGGKGKTSAALGAAFKNIPPGGIAYFLQFEKDADEAELLRKFEPEFKVFNFDTDSAISFVKKVISSKECDVLVLDEILSLIETREDGEQIITDILALARKNITRIIITGNFITDNIAMEADYITELKRTK